MIGQLSSRTSPRQAIVVDAAFLRAPGAVRTGQVARTLTDEVSPALLLDLLGSLVGVNGATIAVLAAGPEHGRAISALIPPGIDVITPPLDAADRGRLAWALESHLKRAFSRVVVIAADVPALPTRTVATALSTLSAVDLVVGPTPDRRLYLLGIRDEIGLALITDAGGGAGFVGTDLNAISAVADDRKASIRMLEHRRRFDAESGVDSIREAVAASPISAPRMTALLRTPAEAPHATGHLHRDGASGHGVQS